MSSSKIDIDDLATTVLAELRRYRGAIMMTVTDAVKLTAKETVKDIKERAKQLFKSSTNEYAKSWAAKQEMSKNKSRYDMVVYAKDPHYRLTHLLENGHAKVNGGRVKGRPHIAPAEETAAENLVKYITEGIE